MKYPVKILCAKHGIGWLGRSPLPRPSPAGRGRAVRRCLKKKRLSDGRKAHTFFLTTDGFPLPAGEGSRVRESVHASTRFPGERDVFHLETLKYLTALILLLALLLATQAIASTFGNITMGGGGYRTTAVEDCATAARDRDPTAEKRVSMGLFPMLCWEIQEKRGGARTACPRVLL